MKSGIIKLYLNNIRVIRLAGAQIPVASNIQLNKIELFKAIDWAKANGVDHLLTPEGSLSGYQNINGREKELIDALKEVELHARGLSLHLGTIIKEKEEKGYINISAKRGLIGNVFKFL